MKKTLLANAFISLVILLTHPAWGQPRPRNAQPKVHPKQPSNFSWGESGSGQQPQQNQRRNRPRTRATSQTIEVENDETHRTKPRNQAQATNARTETVSHNESLRKRQSPAIKFDGIDGEIKSRKPNAAKYDGIDGEANDAKTKNPNATRKAQNILPYLEQDNVYKTARPKTPNRKRRAKMVK